MSKLDQDPEQAAKELGLDLLKPGPYDVFLDIDNATDNAFLSLMLDVLRNNGIEFNVMLTTTSKSGNKHTYLRFTRPISAIERIAIQACLGSDRVRELLSLLRIWTNAECPPTAFFEKPGTVTFDLNRFPTFPTP